MSRPVGPICCQCSVEMKPDDNGIVVVLHAFEPPQPYEAWDSDRYICPKCGLKVCTGYGGKALAAHYEPERMEQVLTGAERAKTRQDCYER
jgi:hypothetical protein